MHPQGQEGKLLNTQNQEGKLPNTQEQEGNLLQEGKLMRTLQEGKMHC